MERNHIDAEYQLQASVIVLGYNGLGYVDDCLGSVLDQNFPVDQYEVIWADNASSDSSADHVALRFPTVRLLRFDCNYGFAEGNNRAAKKALGRYLVFLNQDTIVHRNWLRALVETMLNDADIAACQANMLMPWHAGFQSFDRVNYPDTVYYADVNCYGYVEYRERPMRNEVIIPCVFLSGASFIIDREVVARLPYIFDPLFTTYSEDLDLSLCLQSLGYRVAVAPRAIVYHLQFSEVSDYRAAFSKIYLSTRNRILAHYKVMPVYRFVIFLPLLIWGGFLKIKQLHFEWKQELMTMLLMLPVSVLALAGAIRLMPQVRRVLQQTDFVSR